MMTAANETLCREIAEAEGWKFRDGGWHWSWMAPGDSRWEYCNHPAYLTDAAETVRMLEALCKHWNRVLLTRSHVTGQITIACYQNDGMLDHFYLGDSLSQIVAQAYLAMLQSLEHAREGER